MHTHSFLFSIAASALILAATCSPVSAATPAASTTAAKTKAAPAVTPENPISYDDLRQHIGARIIVHTTFKTTRSGVLTRFSNTELALQVDAPSGSTELTIPKNTVRSVALPAAPSTEPGKPSAKKN